MKEIWKLFKEEYEYNGRLFPAIYISNMGNIKGRKVYINNKGYSEFVYNKKHYRVHRIVAEMFIPNPENKQEIDHINTIKTDNRVENLKWCAHKENMNNPLTLPLLYQNATKKVYQYDLDGNFIKEWESIRIASKELNANETNIGFCCQGKRNKCKNFKWKYTKD